jgi:hypothetical protein
MIEGLLSTVFVNVFVNGLLSSGRLGMCRSWTVDLVPKPLLGPKINASRDRPHHRRPSVSDTVVYPVTRSVPSTLLQAETPMASAVMASWNLGPRMGAGAG